MRVRCSERPRACDEYGYIMNKRLRDEANEMAATRWGRKEGKEVVSGGKRARSGWDGRLRGRQDERQSEWEARRRKRRVVVDEDEEEEGEAEMQTRVEAALGAEGQMRDAGGKRMLAWADLRERRRQRLADDRPSRRLGANRGGRCGKRIRVEEEEQEEGGGRQDAAVMLVAASEEGCVRRHPSGAGRGVKQRRGGETGE